MEIDPRLRDSTSANAYSPQQQANSALQTSTPLAPNPSQRAPGVHSHAHAQYVSISPHQHQDIYADTTPHSAGSNPGNPGHTGSQDGTNDANDPKRSRACEACRGLKVRCEPDQNNPDQPCKRCAKANRICVISAPTRKRQKKTDSRVAELEKKINALTATLHAQGAGPAAAATSGPGDGTALEDGGHVQVRQHPYQQVNNGGYGTPYNPGRPEAPADEWSPYPRQPELDTRKISAPPMVVAGQKRKHIDSFSNASQSPASVLTGNQKQTLESVGIFHTFAPGAQTTAITHEYADVVDKGLTTAEDATKMFNWYVEKMAPHMPAVVFPSGTTAAEIRKTKPTLFLAILSASAGSLHPELQRTFTKEVMNVYAERIICSGDKTLELIQALIVSCIWYWPPEHFEELKFYQLIHMAAVMAIDIGMNKKSKQKTGVGGLFRDNPWRRTPFPDPASIESRRTWLTCYFLCCNASMGLRRPNLIRWNSFMAECVEVLESSPDALPSDKLFTQWIRSQHIAEDIGTSFSMDDPSAKVSITDQNVQLALKGFEIELETWSKQIVPGPNSATLQLTEHVVNLYMHEVAMHVDHNVEEFKPPFTERLSRGLTNADGDQISLSSVHIRALSMCLKSIDGIFETFLKFDVETIQCLPVANFVRVAYAVVVLIKMYFAAAIPNSSFGKVIDKDNMKVEYYLDGLVTLFRKASADEKSPPSAKFLMVLMMLKTWFHRQREEKPNGSSSNDSGVGPVTEAPVEAPGMVKQNSTVQQRPQSSYSPANTPLQLLSEVATGNSGGQSRSGSISNYPGSDWQQQMQFSNYPPMQGQLQQGYGNIGASNIDPALSMDFGNPMGDGFEQAMDLTYGFGDYTGFFEQNNYLGGYMGDTSDSIGPGHYDGGI